MTKQRKHLTILFTDIASSSYLARHMEPEQYLALLNDIRRQLTDRVNAHGGSIIRIDGDGLLCVFGYPDVKETAVYEAVSTALEMHECIDNMRMDHPLTDGNLKLKTAIHSGVVLTLPGDMEVGRLEIIGEPTNFTAHLCDYAAPGEILVTEDALGRFSDHFEINKSRVVKLKGRKTSMRVNNITGLDINRQGVETTNNWSPFFGRHDAMQALNAFVTRPSEEPGLLFLQGTAGLGKTRLVKEFSKPLRARNVPVFYSNCEAFLGVRPLQPIFDISYELEALTVLDETTKPSLDAQVKLFQAAENKPDQSRNDLEDIVEAFVLKLERKEKHAIILVIDDWQWADKSTRAVVAGLLKKGPGSLKVILASRELDSVFSSMHKGTIIQLSPLKKETISAIVKAVVPNIEPFTKSRVEAFSGGNPLFLEELCHAVKDSRLGLEDYQSRSWMNSLIMERFYQLSQDEMDTVNIAAVIGLNIPIWLIEGVNGGVLKSDILRRLQESDFLFPEGKNLRFKHRITREAVYQLIDYTDRKNIHRDVVKTILDYTNSESQDIPHDLLAYHYSKSGESEKSIHHAMIAGNKALTSSSLDKAQAHFKLAIKLSEEIGVSFSKRLSLVMKYFLSTVADPNPNQTEMFVNLSEEAHRLKNMEGVAWSEYWLGNHLYGLGKPNKSVRHLRISYEATKLIDNSKLETQLTANLGQSYASACRYEKAFEYLDRAIQIKKENRSGSKGSGGLAYALSSKAYALGGQGYFTKAESYFDEAVEILQGDKAFVMTSILSQRACSCLWNGFSDVAQDYISAGLELSKATHSKYNYSQCMFMKALILYKDTQDDAHLQQMIEATNWLWHDGIGQNLSLNFANLAEIFSQRQDWPNTKKYAVLALQRSRSGDKMCESQTYCALATTALAGQARRYAQYYCSKAITSAQMRGSVRELENTKRFQDLNAITNH